MKGQIVKISSDLHFVSFENQIYPCKCRGVFRKEHIVPVVVRNVHHHHNHHDYVICKQEGMETHQYDHGLRNEDWCSLAMQQNSCGPRTPMC